MDDVWAYSSPGRIDLNGLYVMSDDVIGAIPDNAQYTIEFYDSYHALIETQIITNSKRPYKVPELTSDYFPSTTLSHNASDYDYWAGSVTVSYSKPISGEPARLYMLGGLSSLYCGENMKSYLPFDQNAYAVHYAIPVCEPYPLSWDYFSICSQDLSGRTAELQWILN